jgi:hypothetical protein
MSPFEKPTFTRKGLQAWLIAVTILGTFFSIAGFAVITTMNMEKNKTGFKAIEVEQPISFLDTTYLKHDAEKKAPNPPSDRR